MATTVETTSERREGVVRAERVVAGASTAEAFAGAAGVVLPILGLIGVLPVYMAIISVIIIGGGLLLEGAGLVTEFSALLSNERTAGTAAPEMASGMTAQVLGGAAGVVLGVISLRVAYPLPLIGAALIALGSCLLLGAGSTARVASLGARGGYSETGNRVADEVARTAAGAEVFTGLGATVLGILIVAGIGGPVVGLVLSLAGALALGSSVLLAGSSLGAKMVGVLRR